jgi:hypothetical protein
MALQVETVAVPVSKGLDLLTPARLVTPDSLLEAVNARLYGGGSEKRHGHVAHKVRSGTYPANSGSYTLSTPSITPYGAKVLDSAWLWGWGIVTDPRSLDRAGDPNIISPYPEPGYLFGGGSRDTERLGWTGHSLLSFSPSQDSLGNYAEVNAVMPALNSVPIAKQQTKQIRPDAADNGVCRVVCWEDPDNTLVRYSVYDSVTGAPILVGNTLNATTPHSPRIFSLGSHFHIVLWDEDVDILRVYSFEQTAPSTITTRDLGDCQAYFDVWKVDETRAVVLRVSVGFAMRINWIGVSGPKPADETDFNVVTADTVNQCAIAVHPVNGDLGIAFITPHTSTNPDAVRFGAYPRAGSGGDLSYNIATIAAAYQGQDNRITIAPRYLFQSDDSSLFDVYFSLTAGTGSTNQLITRICASRDTAYNPTTKFHLRLASHAFRVGNRTFIWASYKSDIVLVQNTWVLLDQALNPVGKLDFSTADSPTDPAINPSDPAHLASVNYVLFNNQKDQLVYHLALGYRVRVPTSSDNTGLFTEPSIHFVNMDFLPPFRAVQAGRTLYTVGAQVGAYDGQEYTEAGFHLAPEGTLGVADIGGGLTASGTYSYRVDLCYKNGQGEEIRSHSFILGPLTLSGGQDSIVLTLQTVLTTRANSYYLIFRNAMISGAPTSTFNLINSRDPSSTKFLRNNQSVATVQFTDDGSVGDLAGQANEEHPANAAGFIQPLTAQAAEVIAAGRDRVWLAGGEIPFGQIAPSRLFEPGEAVSFNASLNIQVDRGEQPITGIGFTGEIAAIFRAQYTYILEGDGPDNVAQGFWPPPRLALADAGAVSQESIVLISPGLMFQSPAGFRLMAPSGVLAPIGVNVDFLAQGFNVRGTMISPLKQEARFYGDSSVLVYNYHVDNWSTWTLGATGVTRDDSGNAVLFRTDGFIWIETPGYFRDADAPYEHRIRFPWLHAGNLGDFQRVRRIMGIGTNTDGSHKIRVEIYYDEREFPEEYWEWSIPDISQNTDSWGTATWGAGVWGDTASTLGIRDSAWRWVRRPRRQKCSVFSVAISDNGTDGVGFKINALCLQLGKKAGLDKVAPVGGTDVFR